MSIYAVGDIQGCLEPLQRLLATVQFNPENDQLWSVGDIVNRGPQSLETLRFLQQLGSSFRMVLGNHDLHLLAIAAGIRPPNRKDTLDDILAAPDRDELLHWLQHQPLLIQDQGYVMVHAGIPPQWTLAQAKSCAAEVEAVLKDHRASDYFAAMYGNQPDLWSDELAPPDRWRVITNYFTRMRFCSTDGRLELLTKAPASDAPADFAPWFSHPRRKTCDVKILFGHWAALEGKDCGNNLFPLDTGCVWGGQLRLMNLATRELFHSAPGDT